MDARYCHNSEGTNGVSTWHHTFPVECPMKFMKRPTNPLELPTQPLKCPTNLRVSNQLRKASNESSRVCNQLPEVSNKPESVQPTPQCVQPTPHKLTQSVENCLFSYTRLRLSVKLVNNTTIKGKSIEEKTKDIPTNPTNYYPGHRGYSSLFL